jgi:hypothetical protein
MGIRSFRKHTGWYLKGFPVGAELRADLHRVDSVWDLERLTAHLDRSLPYPAGVGEMRRGHTNGPRKVKLPQGWLEDRRLEEIDEAAAVAVSGG